MVNGNGRHDTSGQTGFVHRVGQGQRIHDRCQHAHVIRRSTVHTDRAACDTPKDIAATDHNSDLDTHPGNFSHLFNHTNDGCPVDAKLVVAHERFPRQLQQDTLVGWG